MVKCRKRAKKRRTKGVLQLNPDRKEFRNSPEGQKYRRIGITVISVAAVCLLMVFILFRAEDIADGLNWLIESLRPVLLGLGFGYILSPLDNSIRRGCCRFFLKHDKKGTLTEKKARSRARVCGIVIASLLGIGTVFALLLLIIPSFIESVSNITKVVSDNLTRVIEWINDVNKGEGVFMELLQKALSALQDWINNGLSGAITSLTSSLVSTGMEIMSYLLDFLISFFVMIYTLLEKETFARRVKKLLYAFFRPQKVNRILDVARHSNKIFGDFMSGKLLDSLIIGILCFILMTILGIPYAVLVSVVIGVTNIIPFLGPFIGGVPCGAIVLLSSPQKGIVFIIMFIVLQQVDGNIIGPWILGDRTGVSAFWIITSLLFFKALFGLLGTGMSIFGMIIGVPLFCVIEYLVQRSVNRRLEEKKMPPDVDYKSVESYDEETQSFVMLSPPAEKASLGQRIADFVARKKKAFGLGRKARKDKKSEKKRESESEKKRSDSGQT